MNCTDAREDTTSSTSLSLMLLTCTSLANCPITSSVGSRLPVDKCFIHIFTDYPSCCLGKVTVESIDDVEEMQIMDEAFDILGFKWCV